MDQPETAGIAAFDGRLSDHPNSTCPRLNVFAADEASWDKITTIRTRLNRNFQTFEHFFQPLRRECPSKWYLQSKPLQEKEHETRLMGKRPLAALLQEDVEPQRMTDAQLSLIVAKMSSAPPLSSSFTKNNVSYYGSSHSRLSR
ncbi:MAG: uncharacterized protein KVP18_004176 [Porospora cf. gigantea A]|uniref:uncharacterized protein n=1 Tax=Porospora cf. gigantea A TaxID=2853593 RepID=UPI00355986D4|nr:MAG: hypothetical protein KVP18_004176 [Porospora cf. gigantea A]